VFESEPEIKIEKLLAKKKEKKEKTMMRMSIRQKTEKHAGALAPIVLLLVSSKIYMGTTGLQNRDIVPHDSREICVGEQDIKPAK